MQEWIGRVKAVIDLCESRLDLRRKIDLDFAATDLLVVLLPYLQVGMRLDQFLEMLG